MKILGISNPDFLGVSVATQAICTDWLPVPHMTAPHEWRKLTSAIFHANPQVLVVGGWSKGYTSLLTELRREGHKDFPVLHVSHSTPFHGSYFHDDWRLPEFESAFKTGIVDLLGFVHPQTAEYYQKVRKTFAVFVPHAFTPARRPVEKQDIFRIGILGSPQWYKNVEGALTVARDFEADHARVELVTSAGLNKPREAFLATLSSCSVLIHLSHLECYSNTVQEAWARGIPVITSPASCGLTRFNPLLSPKDVKVLSGLELDSGTDPIQLYRALKLVKDDWGSYSKEIYNSYQNLAANTSAYLGGVFTRLIKDYPNREHDVGFFESPFTKEGIPWQQLPPRL